MNFRLASLLFATLALVSCSLGRPKPEAPPEPELVTEDLEEPPLELTEEATEESAPAPAPTPTPTPTQTQTQTPARVIPVTVDNWLFSPALIRVKKGETVSVELRGAGGMHGFAVPGLGINTPIAAGETKRVTIPTVAAGTFPLLCSIPCGAGHSAMRGEIVVEE